MNASVTTNESIVLEFDLDEPPEKVWRALTERDLLAQWLMPNDGVPIEREVLEAVPSERLSWRQSERVEESQTVESTVTFELERTATGTHVRLLHTDFEIRAVAGAQVQAIGATIIPFAPRRKACASILRFPKIVCMLRSAA